MLKLPAVLAALVAMVHISLSVLDLPRANERFQEKFDTGVVTPAPQGTLARLEGILAFPIPAVLLAGHPSRPPGFEWWAATVINGVLWGLAVYACFALALRVARHE
ncbi:MAG TPA: hypothetical protein VJ885_12475 [Thermoanaerobaculia bacterium]|nr:hypothetical protein [Thermoanaerobaculia bacterium]